MSLRHLFPLLAACAAIGLGQTEPIGSRIIGGSLTTINEYPYAVVVLFAGDLINFIQSCGGSILTTTAILSAAHCFTDELVARTRIRVGSSFASSGGTVHTIRLIINHPQYNVRPLDNDISVLRTSTPITYIPNTVANAFIAGSNYNLADNEPVWAIGWGNISPVGPTSEQLRHVQIWTVNQEVCQSRYGSIITENMLCAGWLDVGGRDQCSMDSGGPLLHHNVIVGVCSFGGECGHPFFPGVNARVSRYTAWIQAVSV